MDNNQNYSYNDSDDDDDASPGLQTPSRAATRKSNRTAASDTGKQYEAEAKDLKEC